LRQGECAPKESTQAAEIMGNACAALNRLGKHGEAAQYAESACELLKKHAGRSGMMQLAAMYHNKSCCHEYNGERTAALQASEKGLALAQKLGLPDDDYLMCQLVQSKADLVASLTDPKLAKKAAVAVDDGSKRRANAIGDFSLSHAPEVLENLLNLKAEAEAASPMMCENERAHQKRMGGVESLTTDAGT